MSREKHVLRGMVAGMAGGLVASWVMNEFMAGPGKKLQEAVEREHEKQREQQQSAEPKQDATMKAADMVVSTATGGRHLSWEEQEKAGPVVHYAFGALMGAIYGALAEFWPGARAGFGTTYGSALFAGADLVAVPVMKLGPAPDELPMSAEASPLAAHMVYGATTEVVRRVVRAVL